ncbi:MAG: ATP-binding protein [Halobacteriovoraceae bacterium]|nr:ATP-binding protein [Halobacteriovoraceae bacterium]
MSDNIFIGRDDELKDLRSLYQAKKSKLIVIYGRRRIGKSTLVEKFCESFESLRFEGLEAEHTPGQIDQFVSGKFLDSWNLSCFLSS